MSSHLAIINTTINAPAALEQLLHPGTLPRHLSTAPRHRRDVFHQHLQINLLLWDLRGMVWSTVSTCGAHGESATKGAWHAAH
ncbi:hypothetical protein MCOR08_008065 [Pyricularia oryzae]|nr:hypothetical protein MCOR34_004444 [Pyricularia oryzae]KAI6394359.1 hypothetical protein MCOR24_009551 [Pyricularia oryzae]KAI6623105.1 hypothetical protein MCOR08_008065 [Pyricularia oryzae]